MGGAPQCGISTLGRPARLWKSARPSVGNEESLKDDALDEYLAKHKIPAMGGVDLLHPNLLYYSKISHFALQLRPLEHEE